MIDLQTVAKINNNYLVMQQFYALALNSIMLNKTLFEIHNYKSCLSVLKTSQKELNELNIDDSDYKIYFDSLKKYLNNAIEEIEKENQ